MDLNLFETLIQNLLHANVSRFDRDGAGAGDFADKYCYNATLQPMFTAGALSAYARSAEERVIYELKDELGIWTQFFRFGDSVLFIGPFVKKEFDPAWARRVLIANGMPAAYEPSVRLYYSAFPILSSTIARNTIVACVHSLAGTVGEYSFHRVETSREEVRLPKKEYRAASLDYSSVYKRYDSENHFLRMVESGDTEHVLMTYRDISAQNFPQNRYVNAVYQDPSVGLSILRALVRKAAERGGASVIEIDEITQRTVQRIAATPHREEQAKCTADMILELTEAVRRHRVNVGGYSAPIRKVVEFIHFNYSQSLSLPDLAKRAGLSVPYLSRQFKKETRMTVLEYIEHLRCALAAEMLENSDASIQEISSYVGYPDGNYFVKVFRKVYQMTPSEYRAGRDQT